MNDENHLEHVLDRLDEAIASGAHTVEIRGHTKTFVRASDLLSERAHVEDLIYQSAIRARRTQALKRDRRIRVLDALTVPIVLFIGFIVWCAFFC